MPAIVVRSWTNHIRAKCLSHFGPALRAFRTLDRHGRKIMPIIALVDDVRVSGGWPDGGRDEIMTEIQQRAARRSGSASGVMVAAGGRPTMGAVTAPLRRLRPLAFPG